MLKWFALRGNEKNKINKVTYDCHESDFNGTVVNESEIYTYVFSPLDFINGRKSVHDAIEIYVHTLSNRIWF
jgi:hypothetical protein